MVTGSGSTSGSRIAVEELGLPGAFALRGGRRPDTGDEIGLVIVSPTGVVVVEELAWKGRVSVRDGLIYQSMWRREGVSRRLAERVEWIDARVRELRPPREIPVRGVLCLVGSARLGERSAAADVVILDLADLATEIQTGRTVLSPAQVVFLHGRLGELLVGVEPASEAPTVPAPTAVPAPTTPADVATPPPAFLVPAPESQPIPAAPVPPTAAPVPPTAAPLPRLIVPDEPIVFIGPGRVPGIARIEVTDEEGAVGGYLDLATRHVTTTSPLVGAILQRALGAFIGSEPSASMPVEDRAAVLEFLGNAGATVEPPPLIVAFLVRRPSGTEELHVWRFHEGGSVALGWYDVGTGIVGPGAVAAGVVRYCGELYRLH